MAKDRSLGAGVLSEGAASSSDPKCPRGFRTSSPERPSSPGAGSLSVRCSDGSPALMSSKRSPSPAFLGGLDACEWKLCLDAQPYLGKAWCVCIHSKVLMTLPFSSTMWLCWYKQCGIQVMTTPMCGCIFGLQLANGQACGQLPRDQEQTCLGTCSKGVSPAVGEICTAPAVNPAQQS